MYTSVAIVVFCLGLLHNFKDQTKIVPLYYLIKCINGTIQSMGWALNLVIFSAWFPKKGKGFFLGVWAANATVGDLIGTQIYKATA